MWTWLMFDAQRHDDMRSRPSHIAVTMKDGKGDRPSHDAPESIAICRLFDLIGFIDV